MGPCLTFPRHHSSHPEAPNTAPYSPISTNPHNSVSSRDVEKVTVVVVVNVVIIVVVNRTPSRVRLTNKAPSQASGNVAASCTRAKRKLVCACSEYVATKEAMASATLGTVRSNELEDDDDKQSLSSR